VDKNGGTILLVEDNPDDVLLTLRAFERINVVKDIIVRNDGMAALDYLLGDEVTGRKPESIPDVVLLDIKLPKIDGLEVLRIMRSHERTKCLPVVMLTSSNEQRDLVSSYHFGANSFVRKPVDFGEFVDAAKQLGLYWLVLNEVPDQAYP
jgi:two-component system response regulator